LAGACETSDSVVADGSRVTASVVRCTLIDICVYELNLVKTKQILTVYSINYFHLTDSACDAVIHAIFSL